jgi:hypothetical protein
MRRLLSCSLLALALAPSSAAAFELNDPLQGATLGQTKGGQLSEQGWTTTDTKDRLWYVVPRLTEGSVEFTVSGITLEKIPLVDHEIFSMYDGGYDLQEPVAYSPDFRNNAYKMLIRIYGQNEPSRTGQQKLLLSLCPVGAPGYHDGICPCSNYFNEEPFGGDPAFDGSPEVLRVEWSPTSMRYLRNGTQIHQTDWSSTGILWGPSKLHVLLGSPRNDLFPDVGMPVGITYSNLKIQGVEGPEGPLCPGSAGAGGDGGSDAGAGGSDAGQGGSDAGSGGSDAGAGGSVAGSGGSDAGAGGSVAGSGGSDAGQGGSVTGVGGTGGAAGSGVTGDGGAAGAAGSSGTGGGASAGKGGALPRNDGEASEDDGGCGCRAAGREAEGGLSLVLALAAWLGRRRRQGARLPPWSAVPGPTSSSTSSPTSPRGPRWPRRSSIPATRRRSARFWGTPGSGPWARTPRPSERS